MSEHEHEERELYEHEHCHDEHHHGEHEHEHKCTCGHCGSEHDGEHHHHDHEEEQHVHELPSEANLIYRVIGIDCPHCAMTLENAVRSLSSVEDAQLIYATATLKVCSKPNVDTTQALREILDTVRSCGQDLALSEAEVEALDAKRSWYAENRELLLMGVSGVALAAGLVLEHLLKLEQSANIFYVIAALAGLVFVFPMAVASLKRKTADMNVLMGIAVLGALIMGFLGDSSVFGDAAMVIFLDQIGEWLEGWSMRKTSGSIRELMNLAPDIVHVKQADGSFADVEVTAAEEGSIIRVLAGERVPLDGIIRSGKSSFNEAALTGESIPRDKGAGEEVFAGSLNEGAVVELEVTADEDCTKLARIVSMVQGAQAEKAPYESFIDRFAEVYTPLVVACAAVVGLVIPLILSLVFGFSGQLWHDWVYRALSLLVVACPCALVISTPVSFVSALTRAAKMGFLVKGGGYFDIGSKLSAVAFDKTGTLTTGEPELVELQSFDSISEEELLRTAATLEAASTHPLARAICAASEARGLELLQADSIEEIPACGMKATISGKQYVCGKADFVKELISHGERIDECAHALGASGKTSLFMVCDGELLGAFGLADALRKNTRETLDQLGELGVSTLAMLSGDNAAAANAIAKEAGINAVYANLMPDDKLEHVRELEKNNVVAMVGDGINDAPALAIADIGITMGAAASDAALEIADVALLADDISLLSSFVKLSKRCMNIVKENIIFAILVKALVFVLVIAGIVGMGVAVFADTGVALLVVLNGMRLMLTQDTLW